MLIQKLRKLQCFAGQCLGPLQPTEVLFEQLRIVVNHHPGAGTRGNHHMVERLQQGNLLSGYCHGLLPEPAVVAGLAAAGLSGGYLHPKTQALYQLYAGEANLRP